MWKEKNYIFAEVLSPQKIINIMGFAKSPIRKSQKIYGAQIANPQIALFAEGPQI